MRRALKRVTFAFFAALIVGASYEFIASSVERRNPPGVLVDIGGRRLHLLCIGEGGPLVLFSPSGWSRSVSYSRARNDLAKVTRVCSFDRMGTGWSDSGPAIVSVGTLTNDIRQLIERGRLAIPLLVVASSIGGLEADLLARQSPERVAGLVMLDAANSEAIAAFESTATPDMWANIPTACRLLDVAAPFGLVRLAAGPPDRLKTLCALSRGAAQTRVEFDNAPPLRTDLPLAVLSAETMAGLVPPIPLLAGRLQQFATERRPRLVEAQRILATRTTRGSWNIVPGSGHLIADDRPDVVVNTVVRMLDDLRQRVGPKTGLP